MADERPEQPDSTANRSHSKPLIDQEELDRAVAEAQESARRALEEAKSAPALPSEAPVAPPEPGSISLPPDLGPVSQDELDRAEQEHREKSGVAAPISEAPEDADIPAKPEGDESLGQDEIDKLLNAVESTTDSVSKAETSEVPAEHESDASSAYAPPMGADLGQTVVSQEEVDRAVAAAEELAKRRNEEAKAVAPATPEPSALPSPEPVGPLPPDLGVIGQSELDSALQEHFNSAKQTDAAKQAPQETADSQLEAGETVDQDEIEAMLKAVQAGRNTESEPAAVPEETTADADVGDSQEVAPQMAADNTFEDVDQDAIDRLIREAAERVTAQAQTEDTHTEDTVEPAVDASPASPTDSADEGDAGSVGQNDIEALLASITGATGNDEAAKESQPAAESPDTVAESVAPSAQPPEPDATADDELQLPQEDLDELLAGASAEESLNNQDLDEPLTESSAEDAGEEDAEVEAVAQTTDSAPLETPPEEAAAEVDAAPAQEDPVERANRGAAESEVGSENLAAAVPDAESLLESIIADAGAQDGETAPSEESPVDDAIPSAEELADRRPEEAAPPRDDMVVQLGEDELAELDVQHESPDQLTADGTVRTDFRRSLTRDLKKHLGEFTRSGSLKTWTSLAAGILCTVGTFLFLQFNQHRLPDFGMISAPAPGDLGGLVRSAEELIDMKKYAEAEELLKPVVKGAESSPNLAEAEYLYIKSKYLQLPSVVTDQEAKSLHKDIDDLVSFVPSFHRNPELLRWKADLYDRSGALAAALSTYRNIISEYRDASGGDETLIQAARLANRMKHSEDAEQFLVKLLQRFPASPHAPEAKLLLGDAQRDAGKLDDARKLYTQVAVGQDFSPIGAEATARLAKLEMDQGNYTQAIRELEHRLETATTVEGNDAIYLLLAKAYRAHGDLDKAESILRELISFFPESEHTAAAFVDLSQTLDAKGNRREALRIASQASERFADNPEVLINEGELEQRHGNDKDAAEKYLEAVDAGGTDPQTLLAAGNAFARVNELAKAHKTLDRLLTKYPTSPEAFEGNIALAKVLQKQGQSEAAVERLTNLADASAGKPQQVSLLLALGDLYNELGFHERAAQQYEDAATVTNDSAVLARSVVALFDAGDANSGLAIAPRVDTSQVPPKLAYEFLSKYGQTLLRMDSVMALEKMEQAYKQYPDERTEEGDRALLNAYLVMGQTARARALVMDLRTYAQSHPDAGPRLQRTAIQWADALFSRGDYPAAAQAYALAADSAPDRDDAKWANFQQANALMKMDEYGKSLALLDAVAKSGAPFAEDARLKAEYARLEQRLRGEPIAAPMGG